MEEISLCCGESARTAIVACSGASNVGQVANALMLELDRRGIVLPGRHRRRPFRFRRKRKGG